MRVAWRRGAYDWHCGASVAVGTQPTPPCTSRPPAPLTIALPPPPSTPRTAAARLPAARLRPQGNNDGDRHGAQQRLLPVFILFSQLAPLGRALGRQERAAVAALIILPFAHSRIITGAPVPPLNPHTPGQGVPAQGRVVRPRQAQLAQVLGVEAAGRRQVRRPGPRRRQVRRGSRQPPASEAAEGSALLLAPVTWVALLGRSGFDPSLSPSFSSRSPPPLLLLHSLPPPPLLLTLPLATGSDVAWFFCTVVGIFNLLFGS
jgi:hypothetical protein